MLYSQCPHCLTIYKLSPETLALGAGHARCGHCHLEFDTLPSLCERLPETIEELPRRAPSAQVPMLNIPAMRPRGHEERILEYSAHHDDVQIEMPHVASPMPRAAAPFVAAAAVRPRVSRWWAFGSLVLTLALGGQLAYAERDKLLANEQVRPWLRLACEHLDCRLPLRRDHRSIRLLSRDVRPHPSVPGALIISASMQNQGDEAVEFPYVEIALADLNENRIALRRFAPVEYLSDRTNVERGMPAQGVVSLVFEVADPGRDAVAFEFRFL